MLTSVYIKNFKIIRSDGFHIAPLTVLTGGNGAGKSTLLQALLLAREASRGEDKSTVSLSEPFSMNLGEANEVLHHSANSPTIEVEVQTSHTPTTYSWLFEVAVERRLHLHISNAPSEAPPELTSSGFGFTYLGAERLGPRSILESSPAPRHLLEIGSRGQFVAQVLHELERSTVRPPLLHPNSGEWVTLRAQLERWTSEIVRPIEIQTDWPRGTTGTMIQFKSPGVKADWLRPTNMGFGVSFALPIILAGLVAPVGGLLIIENPEAHLHPSGQSKLGEFLTRVSASGVQVLVETHSDHVLNGIRRALLINQAQSHDDVVIHFFSAPTNGSDAVVREIRLRQNGGLEEWPIGFFDQFEQDLGTIARAQIRPS